ncbi:zim17-type zinc finger protein [Wolffia australiana]
MNAAAAFAHLPAFSPTRRSRTSRSRRNLIMASNTGQDDVCSGNLVPILGDCGAIAPFSKDAAMGMVLSAATGGGWTTGSGMEGPPAPAAGEGLESRGAAAGPWSLFTRSPRRRMLVAFSCNVCGQRTTRAINPHAYTDGTVFVQCCGCLVFHKLVDNLNLFEGMNCYVNPQFQPNGDAPSPDLPAHDDDDLFPRP